MSKGRLSEHIHSNHEQRIRKKPEKKQLRDWCKECVFDPYIPKSGPDKGKRTKYLISKETSPKQYECTACFYKLLQYGRIEVTKPMNWNKHDKRKLDSVFLEEKPKKKREYFIDPLSMSDVMKKKILAKGPLKSKELDKLFEGKQ